MRELTAGSGCSPRSDSPRWLIAAGVTATAYGFIRHARSHSRPYGIPASITDSQASLMELSPVPSGPRRASP